MLASSCVSKKVEPITFCDRGNECKGVPWQSSVLHETKIMKREAGKVAEEVAKAIGTCVCFNNDWQIKNFS